jgi:hypothetical protein
MALNQSSIFRYDPLNTGCQIMQRVARHYMQQSTRAEQLTLSDLGLPEESVEQVRRQETCSAVFLIHMTNNASKRSWQMLIRIICWN